MKLSELVSSYRSTHGLSQRQFADLSGLSNAYICMIERDNNPKTGQPIVPTMQAYAKIARGLGITIQDLFEKIDDSPVSLEAEGIENIIPLPKFKKIPLIGTVACGDPILAEENLDGFVNCVESVPADFALMCRGDSMINARIFDGDIVFIRQQPDVSDGDIAAVLIGDTATLKRVKKYKNKLVLSPCNPVYDDYVYTNEELNEIRILGKAVAFLSAVR